jgi:hypothetical protein
VSAAAAVSASSGWFHAEQSVGGTEGQEPGGVTAVGPGEADHHPHRRGLAGAVRSDEAGDSASCHVEAEIVDGDPAAVPLGE